MGTHDHLHEKLRKALAAVVVAALLSVSISAAAAPGERDESFGENGLVRTGFVKHDDHSMLPKLAEDIALDSDGNIVATGEIGAGSGGWWFGMFRYTPAGVLDGSFGDNGAAMTPAAGDIVFSKGIAVQPDGKPLVVGSGDCPRGACFGVGRYLANGMRDPDFGTDGFVRTNVGWSTSQATSVVIDPKGRILVVGWRYRGGENQIDDTIAVARFLPDGTLDDAFSDNGKTTLNVKYGDEFASDVHLRSDGRIWITGSVDPKYSEDLSDFLIVRLTESGNLDSSFSRDGVRLFDVWDHDVSNGSALAPDGDLVLAGARFPYEWWEAPGEVAVVRFTGSGAVESEFGKKIAGTGPFGAYATDVVVHPDGDVIVTGARWENADRYGESKWFVKRWKANGSREDSWGKNGQVLLDFGTGEDEPHDIEVDPQSRILVGGSVSQNQAIVRLKNS